MAQEDAPVYLLHCFIVAMWSYLPREKVINLGLILPKTFQSRITNCAFKSFLVNKGLNWI
jgi:hypothetical protein